MTRFPIEVETRVRERAKNRCGYCLCPQHLIMGPLEIEHIYPESRGGGDEEDNLALACAVCNKHKSNKIEGVDPLTGEKSSLFNPNTLLWDVPPLKRFIWIATPMLFSLEKLG